MHVSQVVVEITEELVELMLDLVVGIEQPVQLLTTGTIFQQDSFELPEEAVEEHVQDVFTLAVFVFTEK